MLTIKQTGYNPDFPVEAIAWNYNDPIPEWLSDRAKVIIEEDRIKLETRITNIGEIEILDSSGSEVLIKLKNPESYIIYSKTHPLIPLTQKQLRLLYREKN